MFSVARLIGRGAAAACCRVSQSSRYLPAGVLLCCTFVDELLAGIPVVGLPLIRDGLSLSYGQAGLLLSIGGLAGMVAEPLLFAHADRWPRHRVALWATVGLTVCELLAAVAPGFALLLVAMAASGSLGGLALGMAQASLIEAKPASSEKTMMRWMLMGSLGDLLAPMLVVALAAAALSWRAMFAISGVLWLVYAIAQARWPLPTQSTLREQTASGQGWTDVLAALHCPAMLRWAVLLELLCLLDEVLVGFASLYMTDVLGASAAMVGVAIAAAMAATLLSLPIWERLASRISTAVLLRSMALGVLAGLAITLTSTSLWQAAAGQVLMGAAGAGLYPIMKAQAYRLFPGRSGTMLAALACFAPIGAALPWLLGLIAQHFGLPAALCATGLAPLAVLLLVPRRVHGRTVERYTSSQPCASAPPSPTSSSSACPDRERVPLG